MIETRGAAGGSDDGKEGLEVGVVRDGGERNLEGSEDGEDDEGHLAFEERRFERGHGEASGRGKGEELSLNLSGDVKRGVTLTEVGIIPPLMSGDLIECFNAGSRASGRWRPFGRHGD